MIKRQSAKPKAQKGRKNMPYGILAGALHKKGTFTNEKNGEVIAYDNIDLVILTEPSVGGAYDPIEAVGQTIERTAKFPADNLTAVFGEDVHKLSDIHPFIGKKIEYFCDTGKKICKVILNGK